LVEGSFPMIEFDERSSRGEEYTLLDRGE
jgi:hypothetical protein